MLEPLRLADMLVFDATYRRVNIQYRPCLENSCAVRPEFVYKSSPHGTVAVGLQNRNFRPTGCLNNTV